MNIPFIRPWNQRGAVVVSSEIQGKGEDSVVAQRVDDRLVLEVIENNITYAYVELKKLQIAHGGEHGYQRTVKTEKVNKIVKDFNPNIVGVLLVSQRPDGSQWVMDGQHRATAMIALGLEFAAALVYRGLTIEQEAQIFYAPQVTRLSLLPGEKFRARLVAGEPVAHRVKQIVESFGYSLNFDNGETAGGRLCAMAALERAETQYAAGLAPILQIIRDVWGMETDGITAGLITGLAAFHTRYRELYDPARLRMVLRTVANPRRIESEASDYRRLLGGVVTAAVGQIILKHYNHKLQTRRLPDWSSGGKIAKDYAAKD